MPSNMRKMSMLTAAVFIPTIKMRVRGLLGKRTSSSNRGEGDV